MNKESPTRAASLQTARFLSVTAVRLLRIEAARGPSLGSRSRKTQHACIGGRQQAFDDPTRAVCGRGRALLLYLISRHHSGGAGLAHGLFRAVVPQLAMVLLGLLPRP